MLNIKHKINGRNNTKNISYHSKCENSASPYQIILLYSVRKKSNYMLTKLTDKMTNED